MLYSKQYPLIYSDSNTLGHVLTQACPKESVAIPFKDLEVKRSEIELSNKLGAGQFGEVYSGIKNYSSQIILFNSSSTNHSKCMHVTKKGEMKCEIVKWKMWWYEEDFESITKLTRIITITSRADERVKDEEHETRTLTLEPHTACRKGGWGLAKIN